MAKWRKLWEKVKESRDFNDMPDDFTRLFWLLLPTSASREGTLPAHPQLIISRTFPMRTDVTIDMVNEALRWFEERDMIRFYDADGSTYLWITNFSTYQGDTTREAASNYPPCPHDVFMQTSCNIIQTSPSDTDIDIDTYSPNNAPGGAVAAGESSPALLEMDGGGDGGGREEMLAKIPPQSPANTLAFDTPGSAYLCKKLAEEAAAKHRRGAKRFYTLEQKRKFLETEERLGERGVKAAIDLALGKGVCHISRITSYIAKVGVQTPDATVSKLNEMLEAQDGG